MKTVGETLKAAREKKGLDLSYISDTLKIRVKYLEGLENGDYSIFPSPLYIKGFLKNYSKFLGLNEEEMLALYRRGYTTSTKVGSDEDFIVKPVIKTIKFALRPSHIVALFTVLIVGSILFYLVYEYKQFSAPPGLTVSTPSENEIVNSQTIIVTGNTNNSGNKVTINGQQIPNITNNGDFNFSVNLHAQANELVITATNNLNRSTTIKRDVIYLDKSLNISTTPTPKTGSNNQVLYGRISISNDNTYIKLTVDDKPYYEGVLSPGTVKTFQAKQNIVIDTGRPEDTSFSINGQNVSFDGSVRNAAGVEKTAILNIDGTISYK